ncbi:Flp family type IVb pilin [Sphingomonas sp. SFZ2018-12]|uniref:Flp family type IVb pilin n=1 Tax=Sphingomonas sp. SFZ2018-12 TaxID=2683197 RepID=UPI00082DB6D6|nr:MULTISPECIES: Flp family type IVb pilin [unclassified Sphingomonas]MCH4892942.1 Flp family type IVb pilin [Sphingomonas sp. SFZ2018-12]
MQKIRAFLKNNKGATAIEYGLIAALIAVAAIAAMQGLGSSLTSTFENVSGTMTTATGAGGGAAAPAASTGG